MEGGRSFGEEVYHVTLGVNTRLQSSHNDRQSTSIYLHTDTTFVESHHHKPTTRRTAPLERRLDARPTETRLTGQVQSGGATPLSVPLPPPPSALPSGKIKAQSHGYHRIERRPLVFTIPRHPTITSHIAAAFLAASPTNTATATTAFLPSPQLPSKPCTRRDAASAAATASSSPPLR